MSPQSVLDYEVFSGRARDSIESQELKSFEKFITTGILIREGYETFLNPLLKSDDGTSEFPADACGLKGDRIIVAFCSTGVPEDPVWSAMKHVNRSENAQILILSPQEIDRNIIERVAPGALDGGKVRIELLGWFKDTLEETLQDTLRTIELLVNETRMKMMAPLLQKAALKREFRAKINPKLVYHNLAALSEAGLVDEPTEGTYELSQLGKTVLAEFIAFLERTRRTLDDHRSEEVKLIGRR